MTVLRRKRLYRVRLFRDPWVSFRVFRFCRMKRAIYLPRTMQWDMAQQGRFVWTESNAICIQLYVQGRFIQHLPCYPLYILLGRLLRCLLTFLSSLAGRGSVTMILGTRPGSERSFVLPFALPTEL
mgnify:CR=1 FL=1|jgi:hypothetical protein